MLEEAVSADYSLIRGWKADRAGNVVFRNTATNFNPIMGRVGKITIAEVIYFNFYVYISAERN